MELLLWCLVPLLIGFMVLTSWCTRVSISATYVLPQASVVLLSIKERGHSYTVGFWGLHERVDYLMRTRLIGTPQADTTLTSGHRSL